jgi:hypothetical protein
MGRKFIALTCLICALLLADTASAELVGWWTFDGNYDDVSGNGHNGTAEGTPAFAGGQYGQAVQFVHDSGRRRDRNRLFDRLLGEPFCCG